MNAVPTLRSARLDLVSMSPTFLLASLEGRLDDAARELGAALPAAWPDPWRRTLEIRLAELEADPSVQPWLLRAMVLRAPDRHVVGRIGFHGPPGADRRVEIGYAVEPGYRRHGYALEAVEALFDWADTEHGVHRFRASVSPKNAPSLGLVRKLGFSVCGTRWDDEDGEELVFDLARRARHVRLVGTD